MQSTPNLNPSATSDVPGPPERAGAAAWGNAMPAFGRYSAYTTERIAAMRPKLEALVYPERLAATRIRVAGPTERITHDEAQGLDYREAGLGDEFGPMWSTFWFKIAFDLPQNWSGQRVDLWWSSNSEALLILDGQAVQGLNPSKPFHMGRYDAMVYSSAPGGESVSFDIEMACNGLFGLHSPPGLEAPDMGHDRSAHWLEACELRLFDPQAWEISQDYAVLSQLLEACLPPVSPGEGQSPTPRDTDPTWAGHLLYELNRFCNTFDADKRETWDSAQEILAGLLQARNATHAHSISAIGHAHIDTAWLWPVDETHRKCRRTFSSVLRYMDRYPEFRFACSQAYQYEAISRLDAKLFDGILEKVRQGQWVPVGGSWVEPDCNLPSGESLCRQFLYGQRYFEQVFGQRQTVFWNPDVFGYNGQLPQIMREAGLTRFLTQKLSWNKFTSPMHHTFNWCGIDGSSVLAHFPPADTYNGNCSVKELCHHASNYKDYDRGSDAYYLFGYGDGGGGPTPAMIETLRRVEDLQGVPRVQYQAPEEFFGRLEQRTRDIPAVRGELYFELHRGTYTSQARTKQLNAEAERRLHDAEFLLAAAYPDGAPVELKQKLEASWKLALLNQFHDILPGSSIGEVYVRAEMELQQACDTADAVAADAAAQWLGDADAALPINTVGVSRQEVVPDPQGVPVVVQASPYSVGRVGATEDRVALQQLDSGYRLENRHLTVTLSPSGEIQGLVHRDSGREHLYGSGNTLVLYDDCPTLWDAWDVDPSALEAPGRVETPAEAEVLESGPLRASIRFTRPLGSGSTITQVIRLDALSPYLSIENEVDWREKHKLLKVEFPANSIADYATYETQFGAVTRPTHQNTPADAARYECPGQRWVDLSDAGSGLSLLTDCKYGYSVRGNRMAISLLRASTYPDPDQDAGVHRFRYAVYPHAGTWRESDTVGLAKRFSHPLLWARANEPAGEPQSWVQADNPRVVIDTIKPAEDGREVIVRLYESVGAPCKAGISFARPLSQAWLSNTLEDALAPIEHQGGRLDIDLRPYQILTLRVAFDDAT